MNDADRLRAQIPYSTDPDRLERMAREIEAREAPRRRESPGQIILALAAALVGWLIGALSPWPWM